MKSSLYYLIIALLLMILAGCATTGGTSSPQTDRSPREIDRVYITLRGDEQSNAYLHILRGQLEQALEARNIEVGYHVFNPADPAAEEEVVGKITEFNPPYLLTLEQETQSGNQATYTLQLVDSDSQQFIWDTTLTQDGYSASTTNARQAAQDIITAMRREGLIR